MANFVRAESVVREAINFCADSDVIEVGQAGSLGGQEVGKMAESTDERKLPVQ